MYTGQFKLVEADHQKAEVIAHEVHTAKEAV